MATVVNRLYSSGTLATAGNFDEVTYNASNTGTSKNLFAFSQNFTRQGMWAAQYTSSTYPVANYATAPDGTLTASLFAATGQYPLLVPYYYSSSGFLVQAGEVYTYSIYVKYVNQQYCTLAQEGGWAGYYQRFDILNGLVAGGGNLPGWNPTITPVGNSWYRCSVTYTVPAQGSSILTGTQFVGPVTGVGAAFAPQIRIGSYDGTDYAGSQMLIWGAQLELGSTATTYEPTGGVKNYLRYSQDFSKLNTNIWWATDGNVTPSANATQAPDGTQTGSVLISTQNGGNNSALIQQYPQVFETNTNFTFSVYLKQGTSPTTLVNLYNSDPYNAIFGTVTWGATPVMVTSVQSGGVVVASSFTSAGLGWWRLSLTINTLNNVGNLFCRIYVRDNGSNNVAGEYVYVWGAQLEQSSAPGTYIANGPNMFNTIPLQSNPNNNLLTYSQDYTQTAWSKIQSSVSTTGTWDAQPVFFNDGSNLTGWTVSGTTAVSSTIGNPLPSIATPSINSYAYIAVPGVTSLYNTTIQFDVRVNSLGDFFFGCDAAGAGQAVRVGVAAPGYWPVGFITTNSWLSWGTSTGSTYVTADTWYRVRLVITAAGVCSIYLNGTLIATQTFVLNGVYIGLQGDAGGGTQYWDNITVSRNGTAITAPDGSPTGQKVICSTDVVSSFHSIQQSYTITKPQGGYMIFSAFVKPAELSNIGIYQNGGSNGAKWDLSTPTPTLIANDTGVSSYVIPAANGWYRVIMLYQYSANGTYFNNIYLMNPATGFVGDGVSGIYVWGAQLEYVNNSVTNSAQAGLYQKNLASATAIVAAPFSAIKATSDGVLSTASDIDEVTYNAATPVTVNLLGYSQDYTATNVWYQAQSGTITSSATLAPDGTYTATKIAAATAAGITIYPYSSAIVGGQNYAWSCFVKSAEVTQVTLTIWQGSISQYCSARFDLSTGAQVGSTFNNNPYMTVNSALIVAVDNGWYRISLNLSHSLSLPQYSFQTQVGTGNNAGIGNGYYLWGAQWEQNTRPTVYQPVYNSSPLTTIVNRLKSSQNFTDAIWLKQGNVAITANAAAAPDGSLTATKYSLIAPSGRGIDQIFSFSTNQTFTFSIWLKAIVDTTYFIAVVDSATVAVVSTNAALTVAQGWVRVSYTFNAPVNGYYIQFQDLSGNSGDLFYFWGAQLETGSLVNNYQATNAAGGLLVPRPTSKTTSAGQNFIATNYDEYSRVLNTTSGLIMNYDLSYSGSYPGTGVTIYDSTPSKYNGTITTNTASLPTYTSNYGGTFSFPGEFTFSNPINGYAQNGARIVTSIPSGTFSPSSEFTLSCWVNFTNYYLTSVAQQILAYGSTQGAIGTVIGALNYAGYGINWGNDPAYGNVIRVNSTMRASVNQVNTAPFIATPGTWYNVVQTYSSSGNFHGLYVNGVLNNSVAAVTGVFLPQLPTYIEIGSAGASGGGGMTFVIWAQIGQSLVYNRALSATEVLQNYNDVKGRYGL